MFNSDFQFNPSYSLRYYLLFITGDKGLDSLLVCLIMALVMYFHLIDLRMI